MWAQNIEFLLKEKNSIVKTRTRSTKKRKDTNQFINVRERELLQKNHSTFKIYNSKLFIK